MLTKKRILEIVMELKSEKIVPLNELKYKITKEKQSELLNEMAGEKIKQFNEVTEKLIAEGSLLKFMMMKDEILNLSYNDSNFETSGGHYTYYDFKQFADKILANKITVGSMISVSSTIVAKHLKTNAEYLNLISEISQIENEFGKLYNNIYVRNDVATINKYLKSEGLEVLFPGLDDGQPMSTALTAIPLNKHILGIK